MFPIQTLTMPYGTYSGQVLNYNPHGYGTMKFSDGGYYTGEFQNGMFSGKGKQVMSCGNFYEGEFANDDYDGAGTYIWTTGNKYVGQWSKGLISGLGTYTYKDGRSYVGQWLGGFRHGFGTYSVEPDTYEGMWVKSQRCGVHIRRNTEQVFEDLFENGCLVSSTPLEGIVSCIHLEITDDSVKIKGQIDKAVLTFIKQFKPKSVEFEDGKVYDYDDALRIIEEQMK